MYPKQEANYLDSEILDLMENYESGGIIWTLSKLRWLLGCELSQPPWPSRRTHVHQKLAIQLARSSDGTDLPAMDRKHA